MALALCKIKKILHFISQTFSLYIFEVPILIIFENSIAFIFENLTLPICKTLILSFNRRKPVGNE